MELRGHLLVSAVAAYLAAQPAAARTTLNLDFERRGDKPASPDGPFAGGQGYEAVLDDADVRSGKPALRITRRGGRDGFGVATAALSVKPARSKSGVWNFCRSRRVARRDGVSDRRILPDRVYGTWLSANSLI
jgi:hypothetical protein